MTNPLKMTRAEMDHYVWQWVQRHARPEATEPRIAYARSGALSDREMRELVRKLMEEETQP